MSANNATELLNKHILTFEDIAFLRRFYAFRNTKSDDFSMNKFYSHLNKILRKILTNKILRVYLDYDGNGILTGHSKSRLNNEIVWHLFSTHPQTFINSEETSSINVQCNFGYAFDFVVSQTEGQTATIDIIKVTLLDQQYKTSDVEYKQAATTDSYRNSSSRFYSSSRSYYHQPRSHRSKNYNTSAQYGSSRNQNNYYARNPTNSLSQQR